MITEWIYYAIKQKSVSICLCGLSENADLFAAKLDYLQTVRDVVKVRIDAWRYGICLRYSKYEHQGYCYAPFEKRNGYFSDTKISVMPTSKLEV